MLDYLVVGLFVLCISGLIGALNMSSVHWGGAFVSGSLASLLGYYLFGKG